MEICKKCGKLKTPYNCLVGISGGVDSSMVLHYAIKLGLRPLCFSLDNKWNTPESDSNVKNLVEKLKVQFIKYEIDDAKYRKLQGAFLKSGVPNIEIPTDAVIMGASYELAAKHNIKWILSGGNVSEESIMPKSWGYSGRDLTHIKDIYKKMMGKKLTGLPLCGLWKFNYYRWWKKIRIFYLLDYL